MLVVDDSPYTRRVLKAMAESVAEVGAVDLAGNGQIALARAVQRPPDLVLLDLNMPIMDGFTFLRLFRARSESPVLVVSSHGELENVERALELGASGFISKPHDTYRHLGAIAEELRLKIGEQLRRRGQRSAPRAPGRPARPAGAEPFPVLAIGASSGGPSTLQYLLTSLPCDLGAAVLIAQHMPPGFTETFARRLESLLPIPVREARHGEPVVPGAVLVCPGGLHMAVRGRERPRVELEPAGDAQWVPSVDRLFASAAETFERRLTAVVLTGMGSDGAEGVRAVKARGGTVLAESEETAAIFGMPREAAATGCVDEMLPLPEMAVRLIHEASRSERGAGSLPA